MAAGAASRKAPPSNASPASDKPTTIKLKKSGSKIATPSVASSVRSESPATNVDESMASQNGDKKGAAASGSETKRCTHCKLQRPLEGFDAHSKQCLRDKKERKRKEKEAKEAADKAATGEGDSVLSAANDDTPLASLSKTAKDGAKKTAAASSSTNSKKRKADTESVAGDSAAKPPTKKQKKKDAEDTKAKPKTGGGSKPKGPVDVEKQCGVPLPNGAMCARSLTCKSHAMGAKRAVPGRSLPYDVLLAQYQKKNQAKLQKAAIASNQPLPDDLSLDGPTGPIDSDEERDAVMAGISRAAPRPLFIKPIVSAKAKYSHIRMKEMLASAMGGNRGGGLFSTAGWGGYATAAAAASAAASANGLTGPEGMNGTHLQGARRISGQVG